MSGGIAQLVAIGAQDVHLTGNPEVTFFQSSYKRHVNFSRSTELQVIKGNPKPGGMSTVKFERKGDLLSYVYLTVIDTASSNVVTVEDWRDVVDHVDLYIGGQLVDSQSSEFCELIAVDLMATNLTMSSAGGHHDGSGHKSEFYPLRFFFCESVISTLPLVALQYHDVEIQIYWSATADGRGWGFENVPPPNFRIDVHANYIYLDEVERSKVTKGSKDMLITQVQTMKASGQKIQELTFNHPIKYIASSAVSFNQPLDKDDNGVYLPVTPSGLCDPHTRVKMQINGIDLCEFKYAVPHFTSVMSYYHAPFDNGNYQTHFMYPFCLDTARLQPTGTLNFSRLDSARIMTDNVPITSTVYAVNYNILRIENGMAGLMYSN
jgi:hypothetical protein